MKQKIKVLLTDLAYLERNYGAQAIAFPFMEKFNQHFDAEYCFVLPENYYKDNLSFAKKYNFDIFARPKPTIILSKCSHCFKILYGIAKLLLRRKKIMTRREKSQYYSLVDQFKKSDIIIDLSGIEFIGNVSFKRKYNNYLNSICMQRLAEKYNKPYFKYTKSYGPLPHKLYRFLIKRQLKKLPFLFVRGKNNLDEIKKLKLKIPAYSFPDISVAMSPENKNWAKEYLESLGINLSIPTIGISASSVIAGVKNNAQIKSSCGENHIKLCKDLIHLFQSENKQILLIPHSIDDGEDISCCDLALSKKIYNELPNKENVFLLSEMLLNYKQTRAIIGLLEFYVTGRYHGLSSAFSMNIPVVALSWHTKYRDMMSLFLDNFLSVDCRNVDVQNAITLIKKYYTKRDWFVPEDVIKRKKQIIEKINESIKILVKNIKQFKNDEK